MVNLTDFDRGAPYTPRVLSSRCVPCTSPVPSSISCKLPSIKQSSSSSDFRASTESSTFAVSSTILPSSSSSLSIEERTKKEEDLKARSLVHVPRPMSMRRRSSSKVPNALLGIDLNPNRAALPARSNPVARSSKSVKTFLLPAGRILNVNSLSHPKRNLNNIRFLEDMARRSFEVEDLKSALAYVHQARQVSSKVVKEQELSINPINQDELLIKIRMNPKYGNLPSDCDQLLENFGLNKPLIDVVAVFLKGYSKDFFSLKPIKMFKNDQFSNTWKTELKDAGLYPFLTDLVASFLKWDSAEESRMEFFVNLLKYSLRENPYDTQNLNYLALLSWKRLKTSKALELFKLVLQLDIHDKIALRSCACIYLTRGDLRKAQEYADMLLCWDSYDEEMLDILEEIQPGQSKRRINERETHLKHRRSAELYIELAKNSAYYNNIRADNQTLANTAIANRNDFSKIIN